MTLKLNYTLKKINDMYKKTSLIKELVYLKSNLESLTIAIGIARETYIYFPKSSKFTSLNDELSVGFASGVE